MPYNPVVILYDTDGLPLAVAGGVSLPVGTKSLLIAGTDGATVRTLQTTLTGSLKVSREASADPSVSDSGTFSLTSGQTANLDIPTYFADAYAVVLSVSTGGVSAVDVLKGATTLFVKDADATTDVLSALTTGDKKAIVEDAQVGYKTLRFTITAIAAATDIAWEFVAR